LDEYVLWSWSWDELWSWLKDNSSGSWSIFQPSLDDDVLWWLRQLWESLDDDFSWWWWNDFAWNDVVLWGNWSWSEWWSLTDNHWSWFNWEWWSLTDEFWSYWGSLNVFLLTDDNVTWLLWWWWLQEFN